MLSDFTRFCNKDAKIWGNSARFDLGILQNAYNIQNMPIPWDFRKERCLRTLVEYNPTIKSSYKYSGTAHNALEDCYNQINYATEIFKAIKQSV
jgi:hypothetical protein